MSHISSYVSTNSVTPTAMVLHFCAIQMQEHRESSRAADQPADGSMHTPSLGPSAAPTHLTKQVLPILLYTAVDVPKCHSLNPPPSRCCHPSTGYPTSPYYIFCPTTIWRPATAVATPPTVLGLFIDDSMLRASAPSPAGGAWSARPPAGGGSGTLPPCCDAGAPLSLLGVVASPLPPLLGGERPKLAPSPSS